MSNAHAGKWDPHVFELRIRLQKKEEEPKPGNWIPVYQASDAGRVSDDHRLVNQRWGIKPLFCHVYSGQSLLSNMRIQLLSGLGHARWPATRLSCLAIGFSRLACHAYLPTKQLQNPH
ncbi:hypothetical protein ACLOJK_024977 [Asimina triloba]